MTVRTILAILALSGGCDGTGGDDEPPRDGGRAGLSIEWNPRPEVIPSEDSRITRAAFRLSDLRVVGDAGPLAIGMHSLEWARDVVPDAVDVPDAPSGLYSRCLFSLVAPNAGYAYEIEGVVERDDTDVPFAIRDRSTVAIAMDFSKMLAPGGAIELDVRVRIDELVSAVDFSQVPVQDGMLIVDDGSSQLARVRLQLESAFDVDD